MEKKKPRMSPRSQVKESQRSKGRQLDQKQQVGAQTYYLGCDLRDGAMEGRWWALSAHLGTGLKFISLRGLSDHRMTGQPWCIFKGGSLESAA